jgi:hypothetical protein
MRKRSTTIRRVRALRPHQRIGLGLGVVAVCDMEHLKELISKHFNRHAVVARVETSVVFGRETQHALPVSEKELLSAAIASSPPSRTRKASPAVL